MRRIWRTKYEALELSIDVIPGMVEYQDPFNSPWTDPAQVDPDGLRCGFETTEYG
jgi:hypothetical protein